MSGRGTLFCFRISILIAYLHFRCGFLQLQGNKGFMLVFMFQSQTMAQQSQVVDQVPGSVRKGTEQLCCCCLSNKYILGPELLSQTPC